MGMLDWFRSGAKSVGDSQANSSTNRSIEKKLCGISNLAEYIPIGDCQKRESVKVIGVVTNTVSIESEPAHFEVVLADLSGKIKLIWLGRSRIPGIESGQVLTAEGTVGVSSQMSQSTDVDAEDLPPHTEDSQYIEMCLIDPQYSIQVVK